MGDTGSEGSQGLTGNVGDGGEPGRQHPQQARPAWAASWVDFDLIPCRDGKARRVESGVKPLVAGLPRGVVPSCDPGAPGYANETSEARVMRLKGYGNAICAPLAAMFIETCMEVIPYD
jgi:DNA (cytosine-5)-methyltransferase 1